MSALASREHPESPMGLGGGNDNDGRGDFGQSANLDSAKIGIVVGVITVVVLAGALIWLRIRKRRAAARDVERSQEWHGLKDYRSSSSRANLHLDRDHHHNDDDSSAGYSHQHDQLSPRRDQTSSGSAYVPVYLDNVSPPPYSATPLPLSPAAAPLRVANHTQSTSHHGAYHSDVSNANESVSNETSDLTPEHHPIITNGSSPAARQIVGIHNSGVSST